MNGPQESLEEYADRITASWPKPSAAQTARISSLLNAAPLISVAEYQSLEIKRWILHNETPGRFGTFGTDEVAA